MSIDSAMPVDPGLAMQAMQGQELARRKMEMDALRKRLTAEQDPKEKLKEACQGFETMFIQKLWEQMRNNVPKEGYLHSKQESMYQAMYDNEFSKKMAEAGGIGLGAMLYEQLSQRLGESSRTASPGVNPRLPIIPATSSPSNARFTESGRTAPLIKPLYEDFDENAPSNLDRFTLREGLPLAPLPMRPGVLAEPDPAAEDILTPLEAARQARADALDFEAISQELLRQEMKASLGASGKERQGLAVSTWSAPPVQLNKPAGSQITRSREPIAPSVRSASSGAGGLSPEEQSVLAAALQESMADI